MLQEQARREAEKETANKKKQAARDAVQRTLSLMARLHIIRGKVSSRLACHIGKDERQE